MSSYGENTKTARLNLAADAPTYASNAGGTIIAVSGFAPNEVTAADKDVISGGKTIGFEASGNEVTVLPTIKTQAGTTNNKTNTSTPSTGDQS